MKKFLVSLLIIGILALLGAGVVAGVWAAQLAKPEVKVEKPDTTPRVAVQAVEAKEVRDLLYLVGVSEPWEAVTISAEVTGRIEWQGVDDGDAAVKGQDLVRVNTTTLQARLDQVRADHKLAEQEFKRLIELRERGISSPQEYDRAATKAESTAAQLKMAEIDFNHSVIRSEFDGVVDRVFTEPGEFVSVGKPLVRLVQVDRLKVLVGIPERDVPRFKTGDSVTLRFDALPERDIVGRIHQIATTAEPSTRTFITEIEVENTDGVLKPGMIARAALVRALYPEAITVPMFALLSRGSERYVFVENGNRAALRLVKTGFFQNEEVLITSGLAAGDRLVIVGQRTLNDGETVRVVPSVDEQ